MARWWLTQKCQPPKELKVDHTRCIVFKGRPSHPSHHMKFSKTQGKYYCFDCGGTGARILSGKLSAACTGRPKAKQAQQILERLRKKL